MELIKWLQMIDIVLRSCIRYSVIYRLLFYGEGEQAPRREDRVAGLARSGLLGEGPLEVCVRYERLGVGSGHIHAQTVAFLDCECMV